jgi:hypothetical protein
MRLLWEAFPRANSLELALEVVKSWNVGGLRWLLDHKASDLSSRDWVRLFSGACASGSYLCAASVLDFAESALSQVRGFSPIDVVGRALCDRLTSIKSGREVCCIPDNSMALAYTEELSGWLPEATGMILVARHEGRGTASVNAFVDAASGRARTVTFVETENGGSVCGGYLDVAWVAGGRAYDERGRSFMFTLRNHLGVPPSKFVQKRGGSAAFMVRDYRFYFGDKEGFVVWQNDGRLSSGLAYQPPRQGSALFDGDRNGIFRAARWELWEVV